MNIPELRKIKGFKIECGNDEMSAKYDIKPQTGIVLEGEGCNVDIKCKAGMRPSEADTFVLSVCKALTPHPLEPGEWKNFKVAKDTIKVKVSACRQIAKTQEKNHAVPLDMSAPKVAETEPQNKTNAEAKPKTKAKAKRTPEVKKKIMQIPELEDSGNWNTLLSGAANKQVLAAFPLEMGTQPPDENKHAKVAQTGRPSVVSAMSVIVSL